MSFPRYERYKDSGVEWLGDVPEHWIVAPVRSIVQHLDKRNEGAECQDYLSLMANVGVMPYAEKGDVGNKKPEDLSKCKIVRRGNIVINSMNYNIGSYGMSNYDGVCSPVYVVLAINEAVILERFGFRIFQNTAFQRYAQSFGNGILAHRAAIGWNELKVIGVAIPPTKEEQQTILSFLDDEALKINALIEEQQRLIELLKEKRQAVISHAVTKGLDPEVSLNDSGIKWLGSVPDTWTATTVRRIALRVLTGGTPSLDSPTDFNDGGIKWFTPGDWTDSLYLNTSAKCVTPAQLEAGEAKLFPANSTLIISIGGTLGKVGLSREDSSGNQQINAVVPSERVMPEYLTAALSAQTEMMKYLSNSSTIGIMNQEKTKEIAIAIPEIETQREIVDYIDKCLDQIGRLLEAATSSIKLLEERRSALISAAVTGKIDVRNYIPKEAA